MITSSIVGGNLADDVEHQRENTVMKKRIFTINGSASQHSSNEKLIALFSELAKDDFTVTASPALKAVPHFDPELSVENTPDAITEFRREIEKADGVLICTPEYIFSIPSGLKNVIEWCVSTTVFSGKPVGIITASAGGQKGHEELRMIMKTVMARTSDEATLLIQGIKGKINEQGIITESKTREALLTFIDGFKTLVNEGSEADDSLKDR